jgi:hypothetical protein
MPLWALRSTGHDEKNKKLVDFPLLHDQTRHGAPIPDYT